MPRKCYLKRRRYPSPFSDAPVSRLDSLLLAVPILVARRYGESLLDDEDNSRISKLERLNTHYFTASENFRDFSGIKYEIF